MIVTFPVKSESETSPSEFVNTVKSGACSPTFTSFPTSVTELPLNVIDAKTIPPLSNVWFYHSRESKKLQSLIVTFEKKVNCSAANFLKVYVI